MRRLTRSNLEEQGFQGWIPLLGAERSVKLPSSPGVYAVSYEGECPVSWPTQSRGGWHKARNPAVPVARLANEWVDGTDILYIGKTDRTLEKRIGEFARFGAGQPVAHWGGRLVWQLPDAGCLMIGWRESKLGEASQDERKLLSDFLTVHGRLPFANLRR
jgi:hypothetical protein